MEESRRRRWTERVSRWAKVELSDTEEEEEDDWEEVEEEDIEHEGEEVSEDAEGNEGEEGEKMKEGEETEGEGNEVRRWVKENMEVDATEEKDVTEAEEVEGAEREEVNEVEMEAEENGELDMVEAKEVLEAEDRKEQHETEEKNKGEEEEEEDREVTGVDERVCVEAEEEVNEEEKEVKESEEVDEDREREVVKGKEPVEWEEEQGKDAEVKENKKEDEEEEYVEKELDNDVEREFKEDGEVDEEEEQEVMEGEEVEEEQEEEHEIEDVNEEVKEKEEDRSVREKEQVEENADEEEECQEQVQIGQYHPVGQFGEKVRQPVDENIQQNQESTSRQDKTVQEDENLPVESDDDDSELMGSEDECYNFERIKVEEKAVEKQYNDREELESHDEKLLTNCNSGIGMWTSKEEESEKLTDEDKTVADYPIKQKKEIQDEGKNLQEDEEESTDDEEAEHSADEDNNDQDLVKIYHKDDYVTDVFGTLTEFRDSFLLTDLSLSTEDGQSFHVHSAVLAAVSLLIQESLSSRDERQDDNTNVGVQWWSVSLGPEVDHVGLEAVVEFAYTGSMSCLNKDTIQQVKAAAQTLGAPRVLDLCIEEEEKLRKPEGQTKEGRVTAAEQMQISLESIKQLWMDRVGCDVVLEAVRGSLHVHRVILAVGSDYFRGMFTLGMKESNQPCVTLPFLLASELEALVDCSYSGTLPLSWNCVFEITTTALQLQYQPALSLCLNFLQKEINPDSCLDVASFAEAYDMVQLLEVANDYVLRQFQKVACTSKFKDLPARQLLTYLNSHSLCVPSELVVFKAVVAWIQAKPSKRLRLAKELMKTIHFPLMTFKEFKEVQSVKMWSDHSMAELYEAIFEDFCSNETAPQSQCRIYLPKESLVLIGGEQTSEDLGNRSISRELWFGNSLRNHTGIKKAMEWRRLGEMPDPGRFRHEVTVLKGQLYVFGGKKYYGINDTLSSVYRFDPLHNDWECLAEMQEKRCSFSVVVLDGKIYAIGGHCDPDGLESVERYCPITNSWSFTWPLDLPLSAHVAKVLQGQIFVSGGLSSDYQCLASMFLYRPEKGSTYLANMARSRAHHCMETLGECIYVAGGVTMDVHMNVVDQLACEVYNTGTNSWTAIASLPVPHVGAGSAVLEGKFYVLGGYSQEDYSDTTMAHRYDPTTQRWENMGKMPGPNNDIRAALLCLPPHVRS